MKKRNYHGIKFLSMELALLWLLEGATQSYGSSDFNHLSSSNIFGVTFFSLVLPWTVSGDGAKSTAQPPAASSTVQIVDTVPLQDETGRGFANSFFSRSSGSTGSNGLMSNIDFLTQLTTSKQVESEMDPLKCFPKALCGLSAESAAITRRRKTGLIADYIRLMKAVAVNPSVMDKALKKMHNVQDDLPQDDDIGGDSESEEEDEEEDDENGSENDDNNRRRESLSKRTSPASGYGYGSVGAKPSRNKSGKLKSESVLLSSKAPAALTGPQPLPSSAPSGGSQSKKKRAKKDRTLTRSDEFTREFLMEQAHVERLREDGFYNEDGDGTNWWAYQNEDKEPSLEELVDDSGVQLESKSVESYYTFGGKRRPAPPKAHRPNGPAQPYAPELPEMREPKAPPRPRPPQAPKVRVPSTSGSSNSDIGEGVSTTAAIGNFFRGLLGFGNMDNQDREAFHTDNFFQGFQRSLPDGTPTLVTVDKTKEILTTAIEIGESLRSPNQCNSLFNGCKYQYVELLHVIEGIRQSLTEKGKDDFVTTGYSNTDDEAENDSNASGATKIGKKGKKKKKDGSYGYNFSLSGTSQAETLSPDYTAAASKATRESTKKRTGKKKKGSKKKSSKSKDDSEPSLEIGSDEPTMYGSIQQQFDPNNRFKGPKHENYQPNYHYDQSAPQLQHHKYHNSYYSEYENPYDRKPKSFFATVMSWFGFGRK